MTTETLEIQVVEEGSGTNKLIAAVNKLAESTNKLGNVTNKTTINIKEAGEAAKTAAAKTDYLSKSLGGINSAASGLRSVMASVGLALGVKTFTEAADAYTKMSNALRLVSTDQTKINGLMDDSFKIAQKTGTGWSEVAGVYGKVSAATKVLGLSQAQARDVTQTIAQSLQLTGASGESAKAGLLQFQQGLASGVLRGEEFNSVVEQTPGLAQALAAGVKSSGAITIGALREMANNGELTTKVVVEALQRVGKSIDVLASTSAPTIEQGMTRVSNAFTKYIGEADKAGGYSAKLSKYLTVLADNMDTAVPIALGLAGALAFGVLANTINSFVTLGATIVNTVIPAITALTVAMFRNPLLAAVGLLTIGAVIVSMKAFGITISDVAGKMGELATKMAGGLSLTKQQGDAAKTGAAANGQLGTAASGAASGVGTLSSAVTAQGAAAAAASAKVTDATAHIEAWKAVNAAATAQLAAQKTAWDNYVTVLNGAPPAIRGVSSSLATVAPAATSASVGLVKAGIDATGTVGGFRNVAISAYALPSAFTSVGMSASAAGNGFQVLSMNAGQTAEVVTRIGTLAPPLAANMNSVAASTKVASDGMYGLNMGATAANLGISEVVAGSISAETEIGDLSLSFDGASKSADVMANWFRSAAQTNTGLASSAEEARKSLEAQNTAMERSAQAAKQFENNLKRVSAAYNSYGEALKPIDKFLADIKTAEDRLNRTHDEAIRKLMEIGKAAREHEEALLGITSATDRANYATQQFAGTLTENVNMLLSTGQAADRAAHAYDNLATSIGSASTASDNYQTRSRTGGTTNTTGGPNTQTPGGTFGGTGSLEVMLGGTRVGAVDLETQGAGGAATNEMIMSAVTRAQQILSGVTVTDTNHDQITSTFRQLLGAFSSRYHPAFATGGSFMVGGTGGTDSQRVAFRASPNERVTIETPAQVAAREAALMSRGQQPANDTGSRRLQPMIINTIIRSDDFDQYKRSRQQVDQSVMQRQARAYRG